MNRKTVRQIKPRDRIIAALELRSLPDEMIPHYEFQFQLEKEITGRAFIIGIHTFVIDEDDPFKYGFRL